jgi:hypothetical protein
MGIECRANALTLENDGCCDLKSYLLSSMFPFSGARVISGSPPPIPDILYLTGATSNDI